MRSSPIKRAFPAGDIRPALERAVALEPDFDDAHYQLALLEKNAGHYEAAIREFHAMRIVAVHARVCLLAGSGGHIQ